MKNKLPFLTFRGLEDSTVLAVKLNFLERGQILHSIVDAASSRDMAWQQVAHRSSKQFTDEISNTVKWGPRYNVWDLQADNATLRGQRAMEIRETYCNTGVFDISSQRQLYWLNIAYVVPKSHLFRCKYDIDWKKVDQIKISNYIKQLAFAWRSRHGKLYRNKEFFIFGVKQSGNVAIVTILGSQLSICIQNAHIHSIVLHVLNAFSS
jgi:hypothetical protein